MLMSSSSTIIVASFHRIRLVFADLHSYDLGYPGTAHIPDRRSAEVVKIELGNASRDAGKPPGPSNILDLRPLTIKDPFRVRPCVIARLLGFKKKIFHIAFKDGDLASLSVLSFVGIQCNKAAVEIDLAPPDTDHVTAEHRDVLLPFLAKTEKDRRHLLLREGFKSLLDDGARFAKKMALPEGTES
jgi:hypothetical protein